MPNPRTPIETLRLQGGANLARALRREKADAAGKAPTGDHSELIEQIDQLLAQTIKSCKRGNIRHKRSNPSFNHLKILLEVRAALVATSAPEKKSDRQIVAECGALLKKVANNRSGS